MLALVAAVEWFWVCGNLNLINDQALSWKYASRQVWQKSPGCEILCFGDSMIKMGVLPRVVNQVTGRAPSTSRSTAGQRRRAISCSVAP